MRKSLLVFTVLASTVVGVSVERDGADAAPLGCDGVIWTQEDAGRPDLWTGESNGQDASVIAALVAPSTVDEYAVHSPDGVHLAWNSDDQIHIARRDGTGRLEISSVDGALGNNNWPAWSPDGTRIAWTGDDGSSVGDGREIYVADADGDNRIEISGINPGPTGNTQPAWSPDGTRIAWTGDDGTTRQIYVADADGDNRITISDINAGPTDNTQPAWSPDGTRIAWTGNDGAGGEIYVADADGDNRIKISDINAGPIGNNWPAWSPDGTRIAWHGFDGAGTEIYVADADGDNRVKISDINAGPTDNTQPAWSPDGTRIAWTGIVGVNNRKIYVADADGDNRTTISDINAGPTFDTLPKWSPDGTRIAWTGALDGNPATDIFDANADGSDRVTVSGWPSGNDRAVVSPDGAQIAWVGDDGATRHIYVADEDGTNARRISRSGDVAPTANTTPVWSTDSTRLAWSGHDGTTRQIYVASSTGESLAEISSMTSGPTGNTDPAWSNDGTRIAWSGSDGTTRHIYVANADGAQRTKPSATGFEPINNTDPHWSPDDSRLAWSGFAGLETIVTANPDGSDQIRLVEPGSPFAENLQPRWSPDGTAIAWSSEYDDGEDETHHIVVADVDGTDPVVVSATPDVDPTGNNRPRWSPDGGRLAWTGAGDTQGVYVADRDGSNRIPIGTSSTNRTVVEWFPRQGDLSLQVVPSSVVVGEDATFRVEVIESCPHRSVEVDLPIPSCLADATVSVDRGTIDGTDWRIDAVGGMATATITGRVASTDVCGGSAHVVSSVPVMSDPPSAEYSQGGTLRGTVPCPTAPDHGFIDVADTSFADADITCIKELGITTGTSPTTYSPAGFVTREQMAAFIGRTWTRTGHSCPVTSGSGFADVPSSSFAVTHIACIKELGITTGTSPTTYSPAGLVTREQMAAFIARTWRAMGRACPDGQDHSFTDVADTSFADDDISCIAALGITTGTSPTTYSPGGFVTREQMAAFLARLIRTLTVNGAG